MLQIQELIRGGQTMKEKAVIFGAGSKAKMSIKELLEKYEIVAFLDNDPSVWGGQTGRCYNTQPPGYKRDAV